MTEDRCASGACRNGGTRFCGSCRTTCYCSRECQKAHWRRHKLTCDGPNAFSPLRPGVFDFMRLPREVRDKIYEEVIVAKFSSSQQAEYDELSALKGQPDLCNRRRERLDALDRRLMVSPGVSPIDVHGVPVHGFRPLVNARGLLLANRQISQELVETHWSKNTFLILIEDHFLNTPGLPHHDYSVDITKRAKNLYLDVITTDNYPGERGFQACVDAVKVQLDDIVTSLNRSVTKLDSLTIHYVSCFPGELEDLRIDADGLAAHKKALGILIMDSRTDKIELLEHREMKQLYLHSTKIADALCALNMPVSNFRIFGDISGPGLSRLSRKFNIPVPEAHEKLDKYGQRISEQAEKFRAMAANSAVPDMWMNMVRTHEQIFSTRAAAMRKVAMSGLSPSDPEYHRLMSIALPPK